VLIVVRFAIRGILKKVKKMKGEFGFYLWLIALLMLPIAFIYFLTLPKANCSTNIDMESYKLNALFCTELACNENLRNVSLLYRYDNLKEHCQELNLWYPEECG